MTFTCIQGDRRGLQRQLTADGHWAHKASCNFPTMGALLSRPEERRGEGTVSHVSVQPQPHKCLSFPLVSWGLPCPRRMGVGRAQGTQHLKPLTFIPSWLHRSLNGPCYKEEGVMCYERGHALQSRGWAGSSPHMKKFANIELLINKHNPTDCRTSFACLSLSLYGLFKMLTTTTLCGWSHIKGRERSGLLWASVFVFYNLTHRHRNLSRYVGFYSSQTL